MPKIVAVLELDTEDLDESEEFMHALLHAGHLEGILTKDMDFYLIEHSESAGETLH